MKSLRATPWILAYLFAVPAYGIEAGDVSIGGAYLGLAQSIHQDHRTASDARLDQFDFAANLDVEWRPRANIVGIVQLQGGTGGGSLGLQGAGVNVTDLNVAVSFDDPDITLTIGSFDTPFGEETGRLTNNADAFGSPLFLNPLFYSSFGGTTGTLNTLGAMGRWETPWADFTGSVTNGTDESASNADGNFEWVASVGTSRILPGLRLAGSYMASDDTDPAGHSGFGADLRGWMGEAAYSWNDLTHLRGFFGEMRYGDNDAVTRDDVRIWMGEAAWGRGRIQVAARYTGWDPEDADGSNGGVSTVIPNPGLATAQGGITPVRDQEVRRLQAGLSWRFTENLVLKGEWFRDDYRRLSAGRSTDVDGGLLVLNGRF